MEPLQPASSPTGHTALGQPTLNQCSFQERNGVDSTFMCLGKCLLLHTCLKTPSISVNRIYSMSKQEKNIESLFFLTFKIFCGERPRLLRCACRNVTLQCNLISIICCLSLQPFLPSNNEHNE